MQAFTHTKEVISKYINKYICIYTQLKTLKKIYVYAIIITGRKTNIITQIKVCIHKYKYSFKCMYTQFIFTHVNVCIHKYTHSYTCFFTT